MPLDGLRAWIGEVERKLDIRTRVFVVLAVIALGGAGAAIVLGADAQTNAVSENDLQLLQTQLEDQIGSESGASTTAQLKTEVKALQDQVKELQEKGGTGTPKEGSKGGASSGGATGSTGSTGTGGSSGSSKGASSQDSAPSSSDIQEILRKAKEQQK